MPKVTINDIAKAAGVSKTAVSFAFNAPDQLAPATVEHIHAIAERLGYSPDPIARSMTTKRTNTLGVLMPQDLALVLGNPFYSEFLRGVGRVCDDVGMTLLLVPPLQGSRLKAIPQAVADGFIVIGLELDRDEVQQLWRRNKPFVIVDGDAPEGVASVNVDDRSGAYQAMAYVLACGHRQIAIVAIESGKARWTEYTGTLGARMAGYQAALMEHGLALDALSVQIVESASTRAGGQAAFQRVWQVATRPTALVTMSDVIALGIMDAAAAAGVVLPDDLSVVGFDDLPEAQHTRPQLTTVRQPTEEKGRLAATLLVEAIVEREQIQHVVLPTELVVRQSVVHI